MSKITDLMEVPNSIAIPDIIGLPPLKGDRESNVNKMILNSMMITDITPCVPNFHEGGLTVFKLSKAWTSYIMELRQLGFTYSGENYLKVAFLGDNIPNETFQNEYSESFLDTLTGGISSVAGELTQMTGARTMTGAGKQFMDPIKASDSIVGTIGRGVSRFAGELESIYGNITNSSPTMKHLGARINKLLGGSRVDFPMIWKNSSFNPTYSFTIRLFNPEPASLKATEKYIIGPLAALLSLGLPKTDDKGETYSYPYFVKLDCKGLFRLESGAISSITVVKGGDNQAIALNQRLQMVDVRLDIVSLFSTMTTRGTGNDRPSLENYLQNLRDKKITYSNFKNSSYVENEIEEIQSMINLLQIANEELPRNRVDSEKRTKVETLSETQPEALSDEVEAVENFAGDTEAVESFAADSTEPEKPAIYKYWDKTKKTYEQTKAKTKSAISKAMKTSPDDIRKAISTKYKGGFK